MKNKEEAAEEEFSDDKEKEEAERGDKGKCKKDEQRKVK